MRHNVSFIKNERGAAGPKVIVALAIVAVIVYVGIKMIPIYYDHYALEDTIKQVALQESPRITKETPKKLTKLIIDSLKDMNAQFEEKNITVKIKGDNKIIIDVEYWRPHNIPGFPKQFRIHHETTPI